MTRLEMLAISPLDKVRFSKLSDEDQEWLLRLEDFVLAEVERRLKLATITQ
jgi:hypothetical protein